MDSTRRRHARSVSRSGAPWGFAACRLRGAVYRRTHVCVRGALSRRRRRSGPRSMAALCRGRWSDVADLRGHAAPAAAAWCGRCDVGCRDLELSQLLCGTAVVVAPAVRAVPTLGDGPRGRNRSGSLRYARGCGRWCRACDQTNRRLPRGLTCPVGALRRRRHQTGLAAAGPCRTGGALGCGRGGPRFCRGDGRPSPDGRRMPLPFRPGRSNGGRALLPAKAVHPEPARRRLRS